MKMLKGLEIMGLKQVQNSESVKKGTRLSFFGNLLSGFMFNKNANPKKPNLNIPGTHFVVKNQPSLKTASSKDVPVFIRPGTKQVPTMESLGGLLKKSSSGISENDLDPKSEVLILRALSAAFVKPAAPSPVKNSGSENVQVQLKKVGNKSVLVLSVKNAEKMEAIQKFVSKIETAAAKNQIKLPVIQVKALPQIQKSSQQAKATGNNKEKMTSGKLSSKTQAFVKNQSSGKEILNSKPQKGKTITPGNRQKSQPDVSPMATKTKQVISDKKVSIAFNGKELKTAEINQPVLKRIPASDTKDTKSGKQVISKKNAPKLLQKTQLKPAQNKENPDVKVNKNAIPLLNKKQMQTVSKSSAPVQKATPVQAKTQAIEEKKISAKPLKSNLNPIKENTNSAKLFKPAAAVIADKPNSTKPVQKSNPVVFKTKAEPTKQKPQKIDTQVRKTIKNGRVHISQESVQRSKLPTVKTNHIKTQNTKIVDEVRPRENGKVRFTDTPQKGKVSQKPVSSPVPSTISTKAELLQQHNKKNTEIIKNSPGNQEKVHTAAKIQPKENIAFTAVINKNAVKPKPKKEVSTPGKQFIKSKEETGKSHKLHDFSEKSISKSGNGQSSKSEAETVLEFGKQGTDKNVQKTVSEAGMTNEMQTSREIQVPVKFAPLVSRINELIQKFKASAKQSSVKTSFKVAAGSAGEVEIQLDEKTKEKTIKIRVESDKVRNELQKTLPQIQQNLLLKGIEFSSIAIDTAPFGSKMNQTQDQQRGSHKSKSKQSKEVQNEQEQPAVTQKKYGYNTIEVIA